MKQRILKLIFFFITACLFQLQLTAQITSGDGLVNACTGTFTDDGGAAGDYAVNVSNQTTIICPDAPGKILTITFSTFASEVNDFGGGCYDDLEIIINTDDTGAGGTSLGAFCGTSTADLPDNGVFTANVNECITFIFNSDSSTADEGWEAAVSCADALADDVEVLSVTAPADGCLLTSSETVTVTILNKGTNSIAIGAASIAITGADNTPTAVTNTTMIATGATEDVVITGVDLSAANTTYTLTATATLAGDEDASNDTGMADVTTATLATLPVGCDFEGFTGSNLSTGCADFKESAGDPPSGTTSFWASPSTSATTALGSTTARINLYTDNRQEWIITPIFTAASNSVVKMDIAITNFNNGDADPDGMQGTDDAVQVMASTDCGETWTSLMTFNAANTTTVTNSLQAITPISLAAYDGMNVQIGIYATDGPTDDLPDYDFHIDNLNIENQLANDAAITAVTPPTGGCFLTNMESVTVTIKNNGSNPIAMGAASVALTGAENTPAAVTNTAVIAPNETEDVVVTGVDLSTAGTTYDLTATVTLSGDGFAGNDSSMGSVTTANIATLAVECNFEGFTGSNLATVFPGFKESEGGNPPSSTSTTSDWSSSGTSATTALGSTTARVNLLGTTKTEWIITPIFTAASNTILKMDIAITNSFSGDADPDGMQGTDDAVQVMASTDCGATWTSLMTFNAANTTTVTNALQAITPISLAAYDGMNVQIGIYATDGPTDDTPSYDFHIDNLSIDNQFADDVRVTAVNPPSEGCLLSSSESVTVTIQNNGLNPIAIGAVSTSLTGAENTPVAVTNATMLAPGATEDVVITGVDLSTEATSYNLTATSTLTGDGNATNDSKMSTVTTATVYLNPSCDFEGFTGSNLSTGCADFKESAGDPPSGTTSLWASPSTSATTALGSTTAKINLYTDNRQEWIITPIFTASIGTTVTMDIAITNFNNGDADSDGMQGTDDAVQVMASTDCGETWTSLMTFNAANTTTVTNALQAITPISLDAYDGMDIQIGIYGTDGPTDDLPDYDFHIDNLTIAAPPLAVELAQFSASADEKVNVIEWTTAIEINAQAYIVERSFNGTTAWEKIGTVAAKGNSTTSLNYSLVDDKPTAIAYYRLISVDMNRQSSTSNVVLVERKGEVGVQVYPVPAQDQVSVDFNGNDNESVTIYITDVTGRLVNQLQMDTRDGLNQTQIDISQLVDGIYFLTLDNGKSRVTNRIVKQ